MEKEEILNEQVLYQNGEPVTYDTYTWPAVRGCQVVDVLAVDASQPAQVDAAGTSVVPVVRHRHYALWVN
jgi:hypothetical protein